MGPGNLTSKVTSDASFHAIHVRRRCSDIQHGDRVYVIIQPVQERGRHQHRIRPISPVIVFAQVIQHPIPPKDCLYSCEYVDTGVRAVQMQFNGPVADGNGGLASVRDSGAVTGDIPVLI